MRRKRALLINPWVEDFKLYDEWMHPLGLYLLADFLRRAAYDTVIINLLERESTEKTKRYGTGRFHAEVIPKPDLYAKIPRKYKRYGISEASALRKLKSSPFPDVVYITSAMTYWIGGVRSTVDLVRKALGDIPVIVGGIAASLIPDRIRSSIESAEVFPGSLFQSETSELLPAHDPTTTYQPDSVSLVTGLRLTNPRYHGPILTSFGCPNNCSYCASRILQPRFIPRLSDVVAEELAFCIQERGIRDFAVYDDALLYNADQSLSSLEQAVNTVGESIRIHTPNGIHTKFTTERVLARMKNLGFTTIRIGYETGSPRYRDDIHRKTSREALKGCIDRVLRQGWSREDVAVYIMAGLPGQSHNEVCEEMKIIADMGCRVNPVFLSPVPGSALFSRYASDYPILKKNPLSHNDSWFITQLPNWSYEKVELVKTLARELNRPH